MLIYKIQRVLNTKCCLDLCPKIKKITRIFFHKKIIPYRLIDEYTTIVGVKKMLIISIKGKNG